MNIKNLEKASLIYARITQLDRDITILGKQAVACIDDDDIKVNLKVTIVNVKEEEAKKAKKEYSESENGSGLYRISWATSPSGDLKPEGTSIIDEDLNDYSKIDLLGALIAIKKNERKNLLGQLVEMGFKV